MVTRTSDGQFEFRFYAPDALNVQIQGTFTQWERRPIDLERDVDGWWSIQIHIKPGDHEFHYIVDGCAWIPDYAANGIRLSESGYWLSLLSIDTEQVFHSDALAGV